MLVLAVSIFNNIANILSEDPTSNQNECPHHPFFRYGLTPWGLFAMITRSSGVLVGEVLTVESVLLTIAVRKVLLRVAL